MGLYFMASRGALLASELSLSPLLRRLLRQIGRARIERCDLRRGRRVVDEIAHAPAPARPRVA